MFLPEYEGSQDDLEAFLDFCDAWLADNTDPNETHYVAEFDHNDDDIIDFEDFAYFASVWEIPSNKESHYYYLHDALGSVRGLIGGKFNREEDREFYNYDVYGKPTDDSVGSAAGNPFLFAGYRYDAETSLYHLRFRAYDPASGRFIQFDPLGYIDSMNLYEYVTNNPINYIDPYGLFERNTDSWWKEGFSWSNPLGYFSEENITKRQQLRQLQQYYEAKYQAVRQERKLRGIDDNWKKECCCVAKDVCVGVIVGIGQGTANTANGLQDAVIGVVNLPASTCNLFGADIYEIPSPDWSEGLLMDEDPFQHQVSKFMGGQSAYFLITVGAGNAMQAAKACKVTPGTQCADDVAKVADDVVDLSKGAKPKTKNPYGSKGKPDHQAKVKELSDKAQKEASMNENVLREKPVQKVDGLNRKPDVQIVNETGKTRKVFEAERKPNSTRNIRREQDYKNHGIDYETHPID